MNADDKEKLPKLIPPTVENPPADLSILIEKGGEALGKLFAENAAAQIKVAEVNLPVAQKNQAMQEELNRRHWDHIDEERKARIGTDKRSYYFAFFVVAFLFVIASIFIYQNDKQNGMAIISLVLGLVAGFLGGQGWEKSRQQKPN